MYILSGLPICSRCIWHLLPEWSLMFLLLLCFSVLCVWGCSVHHSVLCTAFAELKMQCSIEVQSRIRREDSLGIKYYSKYIRCLDHIQDHQSLLTLLSYWLKGITWWIKQRAIMMFHLCWCATLQIDALHGWNIGKLTSIMDLQQLIIEFCCNVHVVCV